MTVLEVMCKVDHINDIIHDIESGKVCFHYKDSSVPLAFPDNLVSTLRAYKDLLISAEVTLSTRK